MVSDVDSLDKADPEGEQSMDLGSGDEDDMSMSPRYQEALQYCVFRKYDQSVHKDRDQALYERVQRALSTLLFVHGEILHFTSVRSRMQKL